MLPLAKPPRSVCLLRLSAIGDTCHAVPILRTLQRAWPETQFTWVIGKTEARLMSLIEGVEFIIVDKRAGFGAGRELRDRLGQRSFDVLLHLQLAFRASLFSTLVPAKYLASAGTIVQSYARGVASGFGRDGTRSIGSPAHFGNC